MRKINTAVLKAKGENEILMSSTNTIEGKKLEVLGLVRGVSIYSKNLVKDIGQSLKSVVGGGLKTYTELLELTTDTATRKMEEKANEMSADVIVGISYSTCNLVDGAAEIIVYGTAAKFV